MLDVKEIGGEISRRPVFSGVFLYFVHCVMFMSFDVKKGKPLKRFTEELLPPATSLKRGVNERRGRYLTVHAGHHFRPSLRDLISKGMPVPGLKAWAILRSPFETFQTGKP
jgi:hypothetical protein